jgi:hypothetical protein
MMADESSSPEKKLYVDEDWKSQVEHEKEAAKQAEQSPQGSTENATASRENASPMPPPDFMFLIGTLYLQGAMALGMLPNPITNKSEVHRDQAKHAIDLLAMLQQKTEGNRTPDESSELEGVLHQLRMAFVNQ